MPAIPQNSGDDNSKRPPTPKPLAVPPPAPPKKNPFGPPKVVPTGAKPKLAPFGRKDEVIESARTDLLLSHYDELNEWWQKAEKVLAGFRLPHHVDLTFNLRETGDPEDPTGCESDCLAWWKWNNEWRICWGVYVRPLQASGYWQVKPICECPMEDRVLAVEYFPALVDAMRKARNNYIPKVSKAVDKLRDAVQSICLE